MLQSFDTLNFSDSLLDQSSGMSRVPWPPQQTPASFAFPTPPKEQYGAPRNPALSLPNYNPFMPSPGGWARMPSPPPANAPPPPIPSFVNPRVTAGPQFQVSSFPFVHTDANFSYGGNYRAPHALPGTTGSVPTVSTRAFDDPSVCSGVLPLIKADIVRPQEPRVEEIDVTKIVADMRGLITKAEDTVSQIMKLLNVKPDPSRKYPAFFPPDSVHGMPAKSRRFVTPPKGSKSDVEALSTDSDNTNVPKLSGDEKVSRVEIPDRSQGRPKELVEGRELLSTMLKNLKNERGLSDNFFYTDAPSVVQVPAFHHIITSDLPGFANTEKWAELASCKECEGYKARPSDVCKALSLSRYWLLKKELASWKGLPLRYTSTQLKVAVALARVRRTDLRNWLLTYLSLFGVLPDRILANHILSLLMFCLRAVHREAAMISARMSASKGKDIEIPLEIDSNVWDSIGEQDTVEDATKNLCAIQGKASFSESPSIECKALFEAGCWLSSQLSPLCDVVASKNLVLCLFKQALEDAAYHITFQDSEPGQTQSELTGLASNGPQLGKGSESLPEANDDRGPFDDASIVGEGVLPLWQIAEAIVAIQEQAAFEQSRKTESDFFNSSRSHRSAIHNAVVARAEEERATRPTYRAVLEHDGLAWQRSQNQNYKKNKTREELLAEERDYKRRRMSYRGKKLQRTPVQVLRDIIGSHMEDIVAAGGIGCFGKRLQDVSASEMETERVEGDDGKITGSKEHRYTQETNNSSELQDKGSKVSHLEASKCSKFGSRASYEHKHGEEKHRQDSRRSVSVSHSSSNHTHHGYDRYGSQLRREHDRHEKSSYGSSDHHFFHREHDSERKYDRWESKLEEEREHRRPHGERHYSRHHSRAHDQRSHL